MWKRLSLDSVPSQKIKVAHVSTFDTKCGIAIYLENLLEYIEPQNRNIKHRVFPINELTIKQLISELREYKPNVVHIQHEWSFFPIHSRFYQLLSVSKDIGATNIITWHTLFIKQMTNIEMETFFKCIDSLVDLHVALTTKCIDILRSWGIDRSKIKHIPSPAYPIVNIPKYDARKRMLPKEYWNKKLVLITGFMAPHKGVMDVIDAISMLKDDNISLMCIGSAHPLSPSNDYLNSCKEYAARKNVDIYVDTRFISDEELANYMACADVIVFNYLYTPASTSAAARRAIASHRPVITTDTLMFYDLKGVLKVPPGSPQALADAIEKLLYDKRLSNKLIEDATRYAEEVSHERIARMHIKMYELFGRNER